MKARDICAKIERIAPPALAEEWDNVGLLIGRADKNVSKIFLCLDLGDREAEEALLSEADLIITHHPVIFRGIKSLTDETASGRRLLRLIEKDITVYSMHTNFDNAEFGMARYAADKIGLRETEPIESEDGLTGTGRIGSLEGEGLTLKELADLVKKAFSVQSVKLYEKNRNSGRRVKKIAIVPGSGRSFWQQAASLGAECLITGDIDHHTALDAMDEDFILMDAGHYGPEQIFMEYMEQYLNRVLEADTEVFTAEVREPYLSL